MPRMQIQYFNYHFQFHHKFAANNAKKLNFEQLCLKWVNFRDKCKWKLNSIWDCSWTKSIFSLIVDFAAERPFVALVYFQKDWIKIQDKPSIQPSYQGNFSSLPSTLSFYMVFYICAQFGAANLSKLFWPFNPHFVQPNPLVSWASLTDLSWSLHSSRALGATLIVSGFQGGIFLCYMNFSLLFPRLALEAFSLCDAITLKHFFHSFQRIDILVKKSEDKFLNKPQNKDERHNGYPT